MIGGRTVVGAVLPAVLLVVAPAVAHHTGVYTPKDNAITTNFKQLKSSVQARRFDVALRLFDAGPLREEMRARATTLPERLEARTRAALAAGDAAAVESALMVFFAALARDLAVDGERQVAAAPAGTANVTAQRFLEAIWRYYNLVDFAVGQRDARASVAMRLAYDEADSLVRSTAAPAAVTKSFRRIGEILSAVVEASRASTRRES